MISKIYSEHSNNFNEDCSEFMKISAKYKHNEDILSDTIKIFKQCKDEIKDTYKNFLEITNANSDNY